MRWKTIVAVLLVLAAVAVALGVRFAAGGDGVGEDGGVEAPRDGTTAQPRSREVSQPRHSGDVPRDNEEQNARMVLRLEAAQDLTTREILALWAPPAGRPAPTPRALLNGVALRAPDSGLPRQFIAALHASARGDDGISPSLSGLLTPWALPYLQEILAEAMDEYLRPFPEVWQLGESSDEYVRFILVGADSQTELLLYLEANLVVDLETIPWPSDRGRSLADGIRGNAANPSILP